jgi:hypothetical protein
MDKNVYLLTIFCLTLLLAQAQSSDFSGTWILQKRTPISGKDYLNGVPGKINIIQNGDTIIIRKHMLNQMGKDTIYIESANFSKASQFLVSPDKLKTVVVHWGDNGLQFTQKINYEDQSSEKLQRRVTFVWKITGNNRLVLNRLDENILTGEVWSMEGLYRKRTY